MPVLICKISFRGLFIICEILRSLEIAHILTLYVYHVYLSVEMKNVGHSNCSFVFAYATCWFSHNTFQMLNIFQA